jgi:hypothetical protein
MSHERKVNNEEIIKLTIHKFCSVILTAIINRNYNKKQTKQIQVNKNNVLGVEVYLPLRCTVLCQ